MASSFLSKKPSQVWDEIRKSWVAATPEEIVRQLWLQRMIRELQYPKSLIAVEKKIPQLQRRIDILCYDPDCKPLLLIECKCEDLDQKAIEQVVGYNHFVKAPFVAVVNEKEVRFQSMELDRLPTYPEMLAWK